MIDKLGSQKMVQSEMNCKQFWWVFEILNAQRLAENHKLQCEA